MRTFLIIILTGICSISVHAQTLYTANLDFYAGTWKYENVQTGEEFVLKLRRTSIVVPYYNNSIRECLVGAYTYKKNGKIVMDCMDKFSLNLDPVNDMPVYATNAGNDPTYLTPNTLWAFVTDFGKFNPKGEVKRTTKNELWVVSDVSPNKLRWVLKNNDGETETHLLFPEDFSIPTDIILTKQSE